MLQLFSHVTRALVFITTVQLKKIEQTVKSIVALPFFSKWYKLLVHKKENWNFNIRINFTFVASLSSPGRSQNSSTFNTLRQCSPIFNTVLKSINLSTPDFTWNFMEKTLQDKFSKLSLTVDTKFQGRVETYSIVVIRPWWPQPPQPGQPQAQPRPATWYALPFPELLIVL
jgi:hypothetical protein